MQSTSNLTEGMWAGDLNNLMRSVVSIDEYESKIDNDAIVIGYSVHDLDAAKDLNRFLQKSAVPILDTDVSPAPDQKGYYLVFVELLRNDEISQTIFDLTDEVSSLTNVEEWQMSVFGNEGVETLTVDDLAKALKRAVVVTAQHKKVARTQRLSDIERKFNEISARIRDAMRLLQKSTISDMKEGRGTIQLDDGVSILEFEVVGIGDDGILEQTQLHEGYISMEPEVLRRCRKLVVGLGEGWDAIVINGHTILSCDHDDRLIVLKDI